MFITIKEIFDILLMTAVVGFIFMNAFDHPRKEQDILDKYLKKSSWSFDWNAFFFAAMVTAPAIILHELGHKITALSFGLSADFNAAYIWLIVAIVLRLVNFPFIFFVPAYVSINGVSSILQRILIAIAGPFVNLTLFITAFLVLKFNKKLKKHQIMFWTLTKNINLFLFIFNILPIPGFDGFNFFSGLWKLSGM